MVEEDSMEQGSSPPTFLLQQGLNLVLFSNRDLNLAIVFEVITVAESLLQWLTILTLKYDLRTSALHLQSLNCIVLPPVTLALIISNSLYKIISPESYTILNT